MFSNSFKGIINVFKLKNLSKMQKSELKATKASIDLQKSASKQFTSDFPLSTHVSLLDMGSSKKKTQLCR